MKDLRYYFPHDYHARHDPKLVRVRRDLGLEGLGLYWCLVEFMYEQGGQLQEDQLHALAYELRLPDDGILLRRLLHDFQLFDLDAHSLLWTSASVTERLALRADKREKAQKNAQQRWKNATAMPPHTDQNATAYQPESDGNANKRKEKEKKRKEKESKEGLPTNDLRDAEASEGQQKTISSSEKKNKPKADQFRPGPADAALLEHPEVAPAWQAFLDYRIRKGWPVSDYALQALLRRLRELRGEDPTGWVELLTISLTRGWRGIFEPSPVSSTTVKRPPTHDKPTLNDRYADAARRLLDGTR